MEITTEENTIENDGEYLTKEMESNFKQLVKNSPSEIEDDIKNYYDQFMTLIKGPEKEKVFDKIEILNTIINKMSVFLKNEEDLPKKIHVYMIEIKSSLYQLNSMKNISSHIVKKYKNGKYIGDYLNGKREGKGVYKYNNGDIYEGEYKNDLKDGEGTYRFENGDIYIGHYKEGNFHGKGKYEYADGDIYEGDYKDDLRDGIGTYTYTNGNKYEGEWKEGLKHGKGTFLYSDGSKYVGDYKNGKKDGKGEFTLIHI
jgi:hypothetical protein